MIYSSLSKNLQFKFCVIIPSNLEFEILLFSQSQKTDARLFKMNFNKTSRLIFCFSLILYDGKSIWAFPDYVSISNSVQSSFGKWHIFTEFFFQAKNLNTYFYQFCGVLWQLFVLTSFWEYCKKTLIFATLYHFHIKIL